MLEYFLPRASSYAGDIDRLFDLITYLVGFWFFLVLGFFFYVLFRFRRRPGVKAQYLTGETHKEKLAIEIPHYAVLLCDLVILVYTFMVWHTIKIDMPEHEEEVGIVAQQWAWKFHHAGADGILGNEDDIVTVNELHLRKDTQYRYVLESIDVMHSFSVPVFRLKQDTIPGRRIFGHFQPILEGEWDIQCAEMCGVMHGGMGARVFIKSDEEYDAWIAANTPAGASGASAYASVTPAAAQTEEDKDNG